MKNKFIIYSIGVALIALIIVIIAVTIPLLQRPKIELPKTSPIVREKPVSKTIYDIDKIKGPAPAQGLESSLGQVYQNYSDEDVGRNMSEGWARVKPEDKKKLMEDLDKNISESKRALEEDPKNKDAKHKLFISETLKKLAASGFNYNLEQMPKERTGASQPKQ